MNIEKLDLANLVGEMMDEIMKLQIFFTFLKCCDYTTKCACHFVVPLVPVICHSDVREEM